MNGEQLPEAGRCAGCAARDQRIAALEAQVAALTTRLAALEAATGPEGPARSAAPFSKGPPKAHPKPPGRKAGPEHGPATYRMVPPRIDAVYEARLPAACPACGGPLAPAGTVPQYQVELPRRAVYRQFNVAVGRCRRCGRRVQGRHHLQTSEALGCCASQLGPEAQAAVVLLNKQMGLSHGKIQQVFAGLWGLPVSRGGLSQVLARAARRCAVAYDQIREAVRASDQITSDETGWRVGGKRACLHVAVGTGAQGPGATLYRIARGRTVAAIMKLIGRKYPGTLVHDGYVGYDWFCWADHQQCLTHLLRRCHELRGQLTGAPRRWVRRIQKLLQAALAARDLREAGQATEAATAAEAERLDGQLGRLLKRVPAHEATSRLAKHLDKHRGALWVFLRRPGIDASNYRAEQALRPAVVNRKVWGGNRTRVGAKTQAVLLSVLRTAWQRGLSVVDLLGRMLCCPDPVRRAALLWDSS